MDARGLALPKFAKRGVSASGEAGAVSGGAAEKDRAVAKGLVAECRALG